MLISQIASYSCVALAALLTGHFNRNTCLLMQLFGQTAAQSKITQTQMFVYIRMGGKCDNSKVKRGMNIGTFLVSLKTFVSGDCTDWGKKNNQPNKH